MAARPRRSGLFPRPLLVGLALGFAIASGSHPSAAFEWTLVGQIGGPIQAFSVAGNRAYVGSGLRLVVLDISDPASMREIGVSTPFPHFVRDVAMSGNYALVAAGPAGLRVVDVSNQMRPIEVGSWDSPGFAEAVAISGNTAFLADGPYGLRIVDITDPARPREISWAYPFSFALDVAVAGRYAYVAAAGAGLLVVDALDPAHPRELATFDTPGFANGVAVNGGHAFIADGWRGVCVADISEPAEPREAGALATLGWALDIDVEEGRAVVADGADGTQVLDVKDPAHPRQIGSLATAGRVRKARLAGSTAFVADERTGLEALDLRDATNLVRIGSFQSVPVALEVAVAPPYAYVAGGRSGMRIVDIGDPARPRELASYAPPDPTLNALSLAARGGYVFLAMLGPTNGAPLQVVDVRDPLRPKLVGTMWTPGAYRQVALQGDVLYVAEEFGLRTIDVSDPLVVHELGFLPLREPGTATYKVTVEGGIAVVAVGGLGIAIVDVSDPSSPKLLSLFSPPTTGGVAVSGNTLCVAGDPVYLIDIASPTAPVELGRVDTPGNGGDVRIVGNEAWVSDGGGGVQVVDLSDRSHPVLARGFDTAAYASSIAVVGGFAYVADGAGGLLILERRATPMPPRGVPAGQPPGRVESSGGTIATGRDRNAGDLSDVSERAGWSSRRTHLPSSASAVGSPRPQAGAASPTQVDTRTAPARAAATCTVTSPGDRGIGTLRACLGSVRTGDTIVFDPAAFPPSSPATISPTDSLPSLTRGGVTIDASNAGAILDGSRSNAREGLLIESDGNRVMGMQLRGWKGAAIHVNGNNNVIGGDRSNGQGPCGQGNVVYENGDGIELRGNFNRVVGNLAGTDVSGKVARGNAGNGVGVHGGGSYNTIGGSTPRERNIISGNLTNGVHLGIGVAGNIVSGNYIGTDITGTSALGNGLWSGIFLEDGPKNTIVGGARPGEGNVISGNNGFAGLFIGGIYTTQNSVVGNLIGLDATGTVALPNTGLAVQVIESSFNRIGGTLPAERNVVVGQISFGGPSGNDNLVLGNYVGTDSTGTRVVGGGGRIDVSDGRTHNFVGGGAAASGNVIAGQGVKISSAGTEFNWILGNNLGTDAEGTRSLGQSTGATITDFAAMNVLQGNLISGNAQTGVSLWREAQSNLLRANRIGVAATAGMSPLPNGLVDVEIAGPNNRIGGTYPGDGNVVAYSGRGVRVLGAVGNSIRGNSIFGHSVSGIELGDGLEGYAVPTITTVTPSRVSGTSCAGCTVDVYSDEDDEGRCWEGSTIADGEGRFSFSSATYLIGPNITVTATDASGTTSQFSQPSRWTPRPPRRRLP